MDNEQTVWVCDALDQIAEALDSLDPLKVEPVNHKAELALIGTGVHKIGDALTRIATAMEQD